MKFEYDSNDESEQQRQGKMRGNERKNLNNAPFRRLVLELGLRCITSASLLRHKT
jgi:hypothetical protein